MRLIAKMVGQLDLDRSLHEPLRELRQQPPGPAISSSVLAPANN